MPKFNRPAVGAGRPSPSSPAPPPAIQPREPPPNIPKATLDLSELPAPEQCTGWELARPFMQKCYDLRCVSDRREVAYVREFYEDLFGEDSDGIGWEVLQARVCYFLHVEGFRYAGRLAEISDNVWQRFRAAWADPGRKKENTMATSPVVRTFKKLAEGTPSLQKPAAPKAAAKPSKPAKAAKPAKASKPAKAAKPPIEGLAALGGTAVARAMGRKGYAWAQALKAAKACGLELSESTAKAYCTKTGGGASMKTPIPNLSGDDWARIRKAAGEPERK